MFGKDEQKIEDLLKSVVERNAQLNVRMTKDKIQTAWISIFGNQFDQYIDKISYSKQILYVKVNSSVFRQELFLGKDKLRNKMNELLGEELIGEVRLT